LRSQIAREALKTYQREAKSELLKSVVQNSIIDALDFHE